MDCARASRDEIAEQYVAGRLTDAEAAAFEEHYFTCDRCFADVEAWRAMGAAIAAAPAAEARSVRGRVPSWLWAAAAAAGVLIVAGIFRYWPSPVQPVEPRTASATPAAPLPAQPPPGAVPEPVMSLAALSAVVPPPYAPTRYQTGDYAGAIPGLAAAAALDARMAAAPFYLGACLLVTGDPAPAIDRFTAVLALGDSGYREDAYYLLAKAHLRAGHVAAAREALTEATLLHGDREAEVRKLLDELGKLDGGAGGRR
jgi:tetratricopeptide (TPR) repeat protein